MLKLAVTMLTSNVKVTKDDVEKYKQKDILEAMLEEMAGEYPNFTRVLVEERDTFLAHSLRLAVDGPWRTAPQNDDGGSAGSRLWSGWLESVTSTASSATGKPSRKMMSPRSSKFQV